MAAGLIQAGTRITAALLQSIAPLSVIKPADQSVSSSTTLQNDADLLLPVAAGATYLLDAYLDYEAAGPGGGDIEWKWAFPGSATLRYTFEAVTTTGTAQVGQTATGSTTLLAGGNGPGNLQGVLMKGSLVMSSTGGTFRLQWAQGTSNATATIVHAQSYVTLWRVS